ncbi:MAG: FtsX-like permease family protein [Calditrichaeota bacterium]|nr:FtsX-like permease family protein [Calditrichota bacterium]
MIPLVRRFIRKQWRRFFITSLGVGLTVMLMLFLMSLYQGVKRGATSYVANCPADIWICQKNSTNILRSSSFLSVSLGEKIKETRGVSQVTGILRLLATADLNNTPVTFFLLGIDPQSSLAKPRTLVKGSADLHSQEIIVDQTLAAKFNLHLNDSLNVQGTNFRIIGITKATNAVIAQFCFTTVHDARKILGFSGFVSFFLIGSDKHVPLGKVIKNLKNKFPDLAFFSKKQFVANNINELKTGLLPVLLTVAFLGIIIGAAIILLMLYSSVLEKREDYAVLKAIGASHGFLARFVFKQSLLIALVGSLAGLFLYLAGAPVIVYFVPSVALHFTWQEAITVAGVALVMAGAGVWVPIHQLSKIYPTEVFRA